MHRTEQTPTSGFEQLIVIITLVLQWNGIRLTFRPFKNAENWKGTY